MGKVALQIFILIASFACGMEESAESAGERTHTVSNQFPVLTDSNTSLRLADSWSDMKCGKPKIFYG